MLRIIPVPAPEGRATLRVEGELRAEWVEVLAGETRRCLGDGRIQQVALDLEHLTYVDAAGRTLLRRLTTMGIRLVRCPPLLDALLSEEPPP
jgi:ABC-type transporter Mla MlaB component